MTVVFGTNDPLTQKIQSPILFREVMRDQFFAKFTGEGETNIIQTKMDLTKEKGDEITFGLRLALSEPGLESADGIVFDDADDDEDLTFRDFSVSLVETGKRIKQRSTMDEQRPAFSYRTEMRTALKEWAVEELENKLITALSTSPSANRQINCDTAGPGTGDVFDTALISAMRRKARVKVGALPKIRPVTVKGKKYYVVLAHDYQIKSLRADENWIAGYSQAGLRGDENPIFAGGAGIWDGNVIHEYERCQLASGGIARALLLGCQAGVIAYGKPFTWFEDKWDTPKRLPVVATTVMWKVAKTAFGDDGSGVEDFGVITADTLYESD